MCEAIQYNDEMQCGSCGLTWDVNDPEPPECLTLTQQSEIHSMKNTPDKPTAAPRQPDQAHCSDCGMTWDRTDPDPPNCPCGNTPPKAPDPTPVYYQNYYTRNLTSEEVSTGRISIKLDPYRICDVLNVRGGAREHILKKALRWTTKGDDEREVIRQIMCACTRRLEMLDEDEGKAV